MSGEYGGREQNFPNMWTSIIMEENNSVESIVFDIELQIHNRSFVPLIFYLPVDVEGTASDPLISSSLSYRSGFVFHHQCLYNAKIPLVYDLQATFHIFQTTSIIQGFSASVQMKTLLFNDSQRCHITC